MTTIDLNKAISVTLWYENQCGDTKFSKPSTYSTNGISFEPSDYAYSHPEFLQETCLERARRLNILDIWTPKIKVTFSASRSSRFSGDRALRIWEKWNAKIFGKKK